MSSAQNHTESLELKQSVEELGIFFEKTNLTPMEARVFALLLVSDPPELDFFAIQRFLGASKSTISNSLKRLLNDGRVDYMTKPGDRRRYFKVSPDKWLRRLKEQAATVSPIATTMNQIIAMREGTGSTEFNQQLCEIQSFFKFLSEEIEGVMQRWNKQTGIDSKKK
ncbi:MarR family transcriptional regulator [Neolewinella aurantiaca]|uniref:MarR family transcriptional regulator n=1 Tax=Neolewinella aurantiaca TaxID=2602767 RepID=A0A5C7FK39_9BACT|nr:helix-turn-helix domain-containing protein [Neolewinella aurantiaca]TXF91024.1 MarR family transcriptional regulator [Neolewinella aurantiaca]